MDETRLINDIVENHQERMQNLKRYYPFFRLMDIRLAQYKTGQYASVDMGYVVMAVLRFFIEYNHFRDLPVTYEAYESFMRDLLARDFQLPPDEKEDGQLIQYIFDKLQGEGRPFVMNWFDPSDHTRHVMHVRLIESYLRNMQVVYKVSADAVAFYLDTKELREESRISIAQLLLTKKIKSRDFEGGMQVLDSINVEVVRLLDEQEALGAALVRDPVKGLQDLEAYHESLLRWFDDEQRLFASNMALVQQLTASAGEEPLSPEAAGKLRQLDMALKNATSRHGQLMQAYLKMQQAGERALSNAKRSRFRRSLDFMDLLGQICRANDAKLLAPVIAPLFLPKIMKTLNLSRLDDLLVMKSEGEETGEQVLPMTEREMPDMEKAAEARIAHNFGFFGSILRQCLEEHPRVTLQMFNEKVAETASEQALRNADYYAFLVHLCRNDMRDFADGKDGGKGPVRFRVTYDEQTLITMPGGNTVTGLIFERMETDGTQES